MSPEMTYVLESLGTVVVFGAAAYGAAWGLRRVGATGPRGPLQILARQPLDGRRAIYLVRVGKRVLIVGAGDGALTRLGVTTVAALDLPAEDIAPRRSFGEALAKILGARR